MEVDSVITWQVSQTLGRRAEDVTYMKWKRQLMAEMVVEVTVDKWER